MFITKLLKLFWNKYCNLSFLAICHSQLPLLRFLASSWYQKAKIGLQMSLRSKKMINYHIKGLYKATKSNFSHWLLHKCFFLFPYQSVSKFWKIDKISLVSFRCIQKWRKFENTNKNILPKTYGFQRYFGLFRPSET